MLDTIPLKKRKPRRILPTKKPKVSIPVNNMSTGMGLNKNTKLKPWVIVVLVLGVVVTGILVYRSSRASISGEFAVPRNISDIQNYIDSLTLQDPTARIVTVNNYAEFSYMPSTTENVATVAYYIDGKIYIASTKKPYNLILDTTRISNGDHTITAVAYNAAEVPIAAVQKKITVNNSADLVRTLNNIITYPWNWFFRL